MRPLPADPSFLLQSGFVAIAVLLVVMLALAQKSWVVLITGAAWLLLTGGLARSGVLADFSSTPPRIALVLFPPFCSPSSLVSLNLETACRSCL